MDKSKGYPTQMFFLQGYLDVNWGSDLDNQRSTSWYFKSKALVWFDSSIAVAVAGNPILHSKFKHVELDLFFVRERVDSGSLQVGHVPSQDQITDTFTKPLYVGLFKKFISQLRVLTDSHEVIGRKESHQARGML
ncbi:hypothetical protein PVK06_005436 [Gossypium arboreum]|uniref:Uncharacterized protein n=1 Tax=Gossypium arboreum TaxID=29729 RepID=A0ABR0QUL1_GOSAR|nr:hypothetical protein PVK06_005436 [Gossypium arboreum]